MYKILSLFTILLFFALPDLFAQCDNAFIQSCSQSNGSSAKYVKHFRIRFEEAKNKKKIEEGRFPVMLMKGNHYRFAVCNDPSKPGSTVVEIANDYAKFGGNFNPESNTEYKVFDYLCTKTGPHYLKMFFKEGKEGCGVCVMSLLTD